MDTTIPQTELHKIVLDARDAERAALAKLASMKPSYFVNAFSAFVPIRHGDTTILANLKDMEEVSNTLDKSRPRYGQQYSAQYRGTAFSPDGDKFRVKFTVDHDTRVTATRHHIIDGAPAREVTVTELRQRAESLDTMIDNLEKSGFTGELLYSPSIRTGDSVDPADPYKQDVANCFAIYSHSTDEKLRLVADYPTREEAFQFMRETRAFFQEYSNAILDVNCTSVKELAKLSRDIKEMENTMSAQTQQRNTDSQRTKPHFNTRVANQLSEQLRDGIAPMQRRGVQDIPYNPASGRAFHGINALNLMMQDRKDDRWMTFDEASTNGFKVKSGEKGTPVQYWPKKRPGETMNKAITAYVFNGEQLDRIPPPPRKPERPDPLERVTDLLKNSGVTVVHDQAERSFYAPRKDEIHLPKPESCKSKEEYCEKALYEYFKATGHPERQNRDTFNAVGAADRAREELICTTATMMMCAELGILHDANRNPELALDWGKSMERHPYELAQSMHQADNAVWATLRQEQAHNISLGFQSNEAWRPVPDASPAKAVETFVNRNAALDLARNEPEKVHSFEYGDRQIHALPGTETILSKQVGEENQTQVKARAEAYDRDGNTYNVVMEYATVLGEDGTMRVAEPAQAVDIAQTVKNISLPLDWNGSVEVRGCIEDMDGIQSGVDKEQAQFFGVYANTHDGEQQHLADFDTEYDAKRYAELVERENKRQTHRDNAQEQERAPQQPREPERAAATEQARETPREPAVSPRDECIAAMKSVGMVVTGDHPVFDKQSHRIEVDGDKKGERSGFYVAHPDGRPSGYCKNNRTGEEKRWSAKGYILDDNQKKALHEQAKENVAKRDGELKAEHDKTAKRLQGNMKRFSVPQEPTPYLKSKGVELHPGVYQHGNSTCIPLQNVAGEVRSMAYVQEDGTKRYAKNSEKEGNFHIVGGMESLKKAPAIVIAEGYATAATITEAVGMPVVAAFDAGNLMHVAKALQNAMPDKPIIIAADNDTKLEAEKGKNPGKSYAQEAAKAVNGIAVFPRFGAGDSNAKSLTDFNDLARKHGDLGKEAVKSQLQPVIDKVVKENAKERGAAAQEKSRGEKELVRT